MFKALLRERKTAIIKVMWRHFVSAILILHVDSTLI